MADTLYIMHAVDEWEGYKYIYGAYSSKEKAIAHLMDNHDDLEYDERVNLWRHKDSQNTQYFYIEEVAVRGN